MPKPPHGSDEERRRRYMAADTLELVTHVIDGDEIALEVLRERHFNLLCRWARMRTSTHSSQDTNASPADDIAQLVRDATQKTIDQLHDLEIKREATLLLSLRNALRQQLESKPVAENVLEATIGADESASYERALAKLEQEECEAIVCRIEFHRSFDQLQKDLELSSQDSARSSFASAVAHLAEEMGHGR